MLGGDATESRKRDSTRAINYLEKKACTGLESVHYGWCSSRSLTVQTLPTPTSEIAPRISTAREGPTDITGTCGYMRQTDLRYGDTSDGLSVHCAPNDQEVERWPPEAASMT